jgi:hypothetical protein
VREIVDIKTDLNPVPQGMRMSLGNSKQVHIQEETMVLLQLTPVFHLLFLLVYLGDLLDQLVQEHNNILVS